MGELTLILGGARSGKSSFAQRLAQESGGKVAYLATAQPGDQEMVARIAAHQAERPDDWITLEAPQAVAQAWQQANLAADTVILDCLTLLVNNLVLGEEEFNAGDTSAPDEAAAGQRVEAEISALLETIAAGEARWLVVSNEVGLGLVPPYPLGRLYRDLLGRANQRLATASDEVYLLVAGIPVPIHPYRQP